MLKVGLASATTLSLTKWNEFGVSSAISVVSAIFLLFIIGTSPLYIGLLLWKNFKNLARPSVKNTFGTIYDSIREN